MSRYFHIVVFALLAFAGVTAFAQEQSCVPRRTAEERAMKQTEMLARDLNISDSIVRDTLSRQAYQSHGSSRADEQFAK